MFLLSDGEYDPLCGSRLWFGNAHTMLPRPDLFRGLNVGATGGLGVRCQPCTAPRGIPGDPDTGQCFCGCYSVALPDLFGTIPDNNSAMGHYVKPYLTERTIYLTSRTPSWPASIPAQTQQCEVGVPSITCEWGWFDEYPSGTHPIYIYLASTAVRAETDADHPVTANLSLVFDLQSIETESAYIEATYTCAEFKSTGGLFTKTSNAGSFFGAWAGGASANVWPDELTLESADCDEVTEVREFETLPCGGCRYYPQTSTTWSTFVGGSQNLCTSGCSCNTPDYLPGAYSASGTITRTVCS